MDKKMIAIDLDGTTLNKASQISPKTQEVLEKACKAGHIVNIATGRPFRSSEMYYKQLNLKSPIVNFNGALVHLPYKKWDDEFKKTLSKEVVYDLINVRKELNLRFLGVESKDMFLVDKYDGVDVSFLSSADMDYLPLTAKNLTEEPTSLMLQTQPGDEVRVSELLTEKFGDVINVNTWGGPFSILEIVAKGIQKAQAIEYLANIQDIKRENIIAFGDEFNDFEMIEFAGHGVVMKNGIERVKNVADDMTEFDNDQDGLARYLEKYLKLAQ